MNAIHVCNSHADRARWLLERQKGLGGSDAPGVLNVAGAWSNQPRVAADKLLALEPETEVPNYVKFGHFVEPFVLAELAAEIGGGATWELDGNLYRSAERPWQLCTIDGNIREGQKLTYAEVKSTAFEDEYTKANKIPEDVWVQVQHQMAALGVRRMYVAVVYRVSMDVAWDEIQRDDEFLNDVLHPAEEVLWNKIVAQDVSDLEVTGSKSCTEALNRLFPVQMDAEPCFLDAEGDEWADVIIANREEIKELEESTDTIKNKIRRLAANAPKIYTADNRYFNYKNQARKQFTVEAKTLRPLLGPFGKAM